MEIATKPLDLDFSSSSSCGGAYYSSAPSSPTQLTELYCGFNELLFSTVNANHKSSLATVPFAWEEKPGVPKGRTELFEDDFSFDLSCHFSQDSVPAEDLFQGGVIKPLGCQTEKKVEIERQRERGRERFCSSVLPSSRSRRTRSLSPLGGSDQRREQHLTATYMVQPSGSTCSTPSVPFSENDSKKWSFMDLFLFRSASDGRAMDRDPLKKYSAIFRKHDQDIRNSGGSGSTSKRRGRVSAHELHYTVNRAVSNDLKKKTYLPYKHGILGRFSFNP